MKNSYLNKISLVVLFSSFWYVGAVFRVVYIDKMAYDGSSTPKDLVLSLVFGLFMVFAFPRIIRWLNFYFAKDNNKS